MPLLAVINAPTSLLGKSVAAASELRSLPLLERLTHRPAVPGEKIRLGPDQQWLGRSWALRVGVLNGAVYKIGLEASTKDRDDAIDLSSAVLDAIEAALGSPAQQGDGLYLWDADDGNVVMQLMSVAGHRHVGVYFTSSIVRHMGVN